MRELENYYLDLALFFGWLIVAQFLLGCHGFLVFPSLKIPLISTSDKMGGNGLNVSQLQAHAGKENVQGHVVLCDLSALPRYQYLCREESACFFPRIQTSYWHLLCIIYSIGLSSFSQMYAV